MRALVGLLVTHLLLGTAWGAADAWSARYEADQPPDKARPSFHLQVPKGAKAEVGDGVLRLTSPGKDGGPAFFAIGQTFPNQRIAASRLGDAAAWDGSRPASVEVRMRVVRVFGGCKLGAMVQVSDGARFWMLSLAPDGLCTPRGKVRHKLDTTQFHTYRITLSAHKATLKVDGRDVPASLLTAARTRRNAVMLGDISSAVCGVSEWDYVRWTSRKAKLWKAFTVEDFWSNDEVELCSPKSEFQFTACVRAERLGDGRVMMAHYGPVNPHGKKPGTCRVYAWTSADGGKTWGSPRDLMHHPDCQAICPSLLRARDGTLWLFYLGYHIHAWKDGEPLMDKTRSDLWVARSADNGETWTDKQIIFRGYTGSSNGAIETSKGHLIVPFSYVVPKPGRLVSACCVSADGGKTWTLSSSLDIGGHGDHAGALEPAVVELKDGRIWMLIRTSKGCFLESFSSDNGLTWTKPKRTPIKSPSAPGHITRLASGRLAFSWNNTMATTKGRDTLSVALSDDEGNTWTKPMECVRSGQVSYPNITEVAPGMLLITCQHIMRGWGKGWPVAFRVSEKALLEH